MAESAFKGFPPRPEVTPLANIFFTEVLPGLSDIAEIKTVMHIMFLLSRRRGYPRFVSLGELHSDPVIVKGLGEPGGNLDDLLRQALKSAVAHGVLLSVPVEMDGQADEAYFINNQSEQETISRVLDGSLKMPRMKVRKTEIPAAPQPSDIYNLYEQNIGLLTPIIAEDLQEAEHRYPADWIQEAFKEAVRANVRSWKYILSILKRWEREGRKDGKSVRDTVAGSDPDKYIKGKYGHVVQR